DKAKQIITISISDNGVGISKADLPKIHNPFYTNKSKGIGLGLTLCYQVVDIHKGNIDIKSRKGKGTTVTVQLPVKRPVNS
ncbi:MAG: ATP-binding protein, partial [Candidatus Omnitrophota bacterium]